MAAPQLSVLVCTFNSGERARHALPRLATALRDASVDTELVVVDDGSTDDTIGVLPALVPGATIVRHHRNLGAAAARNSAAAAARADWLMFFDDDALVDAAAVDRLWDLRSEADCLVPVVRNDDGLIQNAVTHRTFRGDIKFDFAQEPVPEVSYPLGTCFLVHRRVFERAGGFDERFVPNYYEDNAFGWDLRRAGAAIRMVADVVVHHEPHGGNSTQARLLAIRTVIYRNRWLFCLGSLRGWERVRVVALGALRTVHEAWVFRTTGPVRGYLQALARARSMVGPKPPAPPLEGRATIVARAGAQG